MTSIYTEKLADLNADRTSRIKLGLSTDRIDKSIARFEALIADLESARLRALWAKLDAESGYAR